MTESLKQRHSGGSPVINLAGHWFGSMLVVARREVGQPVNVTPQGSLMAEPRRLPRSGCGDDR
jgi:hypothetical protein